MVCGDDRLTDQPMGRSQTCAACAHEAAAEIRSRAEEHVERVVSRCLEKNPAERFQSARDIVFALGEASSGSAAAPAMPWAPSHGTP